MVNQLLIVVLVFNTVALCYIGYFFTRIQSDMNGLRYSMSRIRAELNILRNHFGGVSTPPEVVREAKRDEIKEQQGGRKKITREQRLRLEYENLMFNAGNKLDDYEVIDIAE